MLQRRSRDTLRMGDNYLMKVSPPFLLLPNFLTPLPKLILCHSQCYVSVLITSFNSGHCIIDFSSSLSSSSNTERLCICV